MIKRKRAFTLRYGESNQNDFLIYIENGDTLIRTLSTVIPSAVQRGFLPTDCKYDKVKLIYKGQELNLNLSLEDQSPNIPERAILILRDLTSTIKLQIHYKPDHEPGRMDTFDVSPDKPLAHQLSDFFSGVQKSFTFYKRKPKKFQLVSDGKKLLLDRSLAAQGIESGIDCSLIPRLIFRWPPSRLAIKIAAIAMSILLVLCIWGIYVKFFSSIDNYKVTLMADADCIVSLADTTLNLVAGQPQTGIIPPGAYDLEVLPAAYPIFQQNILLSSSNVKGDSVYQALNIIDRNKGLGTVKLAIGGYKGDPTASNRLFNPVLVNGKSYEVDSFGALQIDLLRGEYEIKFTGLDNKLQKVDFDGEKKVLRPATYRFDFSQFEGSDTYLTFQYSPN